MEAADPVVDGGTLTGHAAGEDTALSIDHAAVVKAIGAGSDPEPAAGLPEPLASVVEYLDTHTDDREFVPTAELVDALDVEPNAFGRQMSDLGCSSQRKRVPTEDGGTRQVRGYLIADIRAAVEEL